jgi:hypothetical protein
MRGTASRCARQRHDQQWCEDSSATDLLPENRLLWASFLSAAGFAGRTSTAIKPHSVIAAMMMGACASRGTASRHTEPAPPCSIAAADSRWLDRALAAAVEVARKYDLPDDAGRAEVFAFDARCLVIVLADGTRRYSSHDGRAPLPTGSVPATITAFAAPSPTSGQPFFAVALPSAWESAGFRSDIPIEAFTLGVVAHEISHVRQFGSYLSAIRRVPGVNRLPAPVNDDVVQRLYGSDTAFAASVRAEIAGFTLAARSPELAEVRELAQTTRARMRRRWAQHFTGERAALAAAQEIFLTLEGSGQWYALQALMHAPSGPHLSHDVAMRAFAQRGGRWSQDLGLAITLVLDRLDPDWPRRVYGSGGETLLQLLDRALMSR